MKKLFLSVIVMASGCYVLLAQQLNMPQASPTQTLKQNFALSNVEVSYSRPGVKGRTIFGDLVPWNAVWRTGANEPTSITFGDEVIIGDKKVPAGKYGLFTIPGQNEWTIIISKQLDVSGPSQYKQDQDVVRVKATPQNLPFPVETFMMVFDKIKPESMELVMLWDQTAIVLPIKAEVESKIMAQIDNAMNKDNRPYFSSAMYYMENGKDLNKALTWFDKAIANNPEAFWAWHQKANCLAKLGKKQDAIAAANKSIELAKAAKNEDYVALNNKLLKTLN
jgi:hypothetical protein